MDIGRRGLLRPAVAAGALLGANLLLAGGLVASALAPRPLRIVPSARAEEELLPGAVPEAAAREFALRAVLHLDNFTPATFEASAEALKRMIAPRSWTGVAASVDRRRQVVKEGRMASQVVPVGARAAGLRVEVDALRRTFISDKLSREARVRYGVELERQPVTEPNPFGLGVVGLKVEETP